MDSTIELFPMRHEENERRSPMILPLPSGILLVDKPEGRSSFSLVAQVRRITGQKKIGHAGTLDPCATGLLILLLSRSWTSRADEFLCHDKAYRTTLRLGVSTDTFDREGKILETSSYVPTMAEVESVLERFQGTQEQIPPMFSAKKIEGVRLYDLARKGKEVERKPIVVRLDVRLVEYTYPYLSLDVRCSKGTYIRSLGHDIGETLSCHAHLENLRRTQSGLFSVENALKEDMLTKETIQAHLITTF